jgi:hypothetical protein
VWGFSQRGVARYQIPPTPGVIFKPRRAIQAILLLQECPPRRRHMMRSREDLLREAQAQFAALEQEAERVAPGVMDLLSVYGGYEDAVLEASRYLGEDRPPATTYNATDSAEP